MKSANNAVSGGGGGLLTEILRTIFCMCASPISCCGCVVIILICKIVLVRVPDKRFIHIQLNCWFVLIIQTISLS